MRTPPDGADYAAVKVGDSSDAINHDAVAAHALMLAMNGWLSPASHFAAGVIAEADELMREWGFEE
jgi:hypothetical protein